MKAEIDVIYQTSGAIVFQSSFRKYPSIAIQGDTLGLLAIQMQEAKEMIESGNIDDECFYRINYVTSLLNSLNHIYKEYGEK